MFKFLQLSHFFFWFNIHSRIMVCIWWPYLLHLLLPFITLKIFKNLGKLAGKTIYNLPSGFLRIKYFSMDTTQILCIAYYFTLGKHMLPVVPCLMMLTLVIWLRPCLPGLWIVKDPFFFSFFVISNLWGDTVRPCEYCFLATMYSIVLPSIGDLSLS